MLDEKSTWYYKSGRNAPKTRDCVLFLAILHEVIHHKTSSHEEALKVEERLLANPPPGFTCGPGLTPEDWQRASGVINEFIRGI